MTWALFLFGLLSFVGLIVVHEWGHFIAARRNGVEVEEFGIGFPPAYWRKRMKSGFDFTLNWLPLGGFVKLKGEHDEDTEKGSFGAAPLSAKVKIMVAGVGMNLITALILFTLVALIGMPKLVDNQFTVQSDTKIVRDVDNKDVVLVGEVVPDSPAARAEIEVDDEIVSIDNVPVDSIEQLPELTSSLAGEEVAVVIKTQNGETEEKTVALATSSPYFGVGSYSGQTGLQLRRSTWSAPIVALGVTRDFTDLTLKGIGTALKGLGSIVAGLFTGNNQARQNGQTEASSQVGGPVAIFVVLKDGSQLGVAFVLMIIAIISLTLAIMNILPIPALDGGRLFVTLLYRGLRKPLTPQLEERIHGTGMAVLLSLFLLITIVDVRRFF